MTDKIEQQQLEVSQAVSAEQRYLSQKEMLLHAQQNQAQYGRWVLASLLAVHAGGLVAITQTGDLAASLFLASGSYLIWGLVAALVAGGLAWINFTIATVVYHGFLKSIRRGHEPRLRGWGVFIAQSILYIAPVVAIISLGFFVAASSNAITALSRAGLEEVTETSAEP